MDHENAYAVADAALSKFFADRSNALGVHLSATPPHSDSELLNTSPVGGVFYTANQSSTESLDLLSDHQTSMQHVSNYTTTQSPFKSDPIHGAPWYSPEMSQPTFNDENPEKISQALQSTSALGESLSATGFFVEDDYINFDNADSQSTNSLSSQYELGTVIESESSSNLTETKRSHKQGHHAHSQEETVANKAAIPTQILEQNIKLDTGGDSVDFALMTDYGCMSPEKPGDPALESSMMFVSCGDTQQSSGPSLSKHTLNETKDPMLFGQALSMITEQDPTGEGAYSTDSFSTVGSLGTDKLAHNGPEHQSPEGQQSILCENGQPIQTPSQMPGCGATQPFATTTQSQNTMHSKGVAYQEHTVKPLSQDMIVGQAKPTNQINEGQQLQPENASFAYNRLTGTPRTGDVYNTNNSLSTTRFLHQAASQPYSRPTRSNDGGPQISFAGASHPQPQQLYQGSMYPDTRGHVAFTSATLNQAQRHSMNPVAYKTGYHNQAFHQPIRGSQQVSLSSPSGQGIPESGAAWVPQKLQGQASHVACPDPAMFYGQRFSDYENTNTIRETSWKNQITAKSRHDKAGQMPGALMNHRYQNQPGYSGSAMGGRPFPSFGREPSAGDQGNHYSVKKPMVTMPQGVHLHQDGWLQHDQICTPNTLHGPNSQVLSNLQVPPDSMVSMAPSYGTSRSYYSHANQSTSIVTSRSQTYGSPEQTSAGFTDDGQDSRGQIYVRKACSSCKLSHVACDVGRPCARCVRLNKADTCQDAERKKRGRPCGSGKRRREEAEDEDHPEDSHSSMRRPVIGHRDIGLTPNVMYLN